MHLSLSGGFDGQDLNLESVGREVTRWTPSPIGFPSGAFTMPEIWLRSEMAECLNLQSRFGAQCKWEPPAGSACQISTTWLTS